jgi:hypothetical protein
MAIPVTTIYCSSIAFGATTWTKTSGGPLRADITHGGTPLMDRTGAAFYPHFTMAVDGMLAATVFIRDISLVKTLVLNTKANLVLIATGKAGVSVTITCKNMVLISVAPVQDRASPGVLSVHFLHEGDASDEVPIS